MTIINWIRHAPIDPKGRYTGHSDISCRLPDKEDYRFGLADIDIAYSSDLRRCVQTARWLFRQRAVLTDPALREQNFGEWEGCSYDDVYNDNPHLDWNKPECIDPPGGESYEAVVGRISLWIEGKLSRHQCERLAVVTHAGVIRAALAHANGLSAGDALNASHDYLSLTKISYGKTIEVLSVNESFQRPS